MCFCFQDALHQNALFVEVEMRRALLETMFMHTIKWYIDYVVNVADNRLNNEQQNNNALKSRASERRRTMANKYLK